MLWTIAVILVVLWLLGLVTSYTWAVYPRIARNRPLLLLFCV